MSLDHRPCSNVRAERGPRTEWGRGIMGNAGRIATWLAIALVALFAGVMSAMEVSGALEREREYRTSPVCASAPTTASACVWEQAFTVRESATNKGAKGKEPTATLLLPNGKPWKVTFRNTDPVLSRMRPGDPVVGVVWHGGIVEVRDPDGLRQQTTLGPVGWPADRAGGALALISFGLVAFVGSLWAVVKRHEPRHQRAAAMVRWHGAALGVAAILTLWAQSNNNWPMGALWAIWGPLALILLATMAASAIAALHGNGQGYALFTERPVPPVTTTRPANRESSMAPGSGGLPREYRMSRRRRNGILAILVAKTAVLLLAVWTEDIPPFWFQLGLSVLMAPTLIVFIVRVPRSATLVDNTGIRVRGITRTRRVAWEEVQDIRAEPVPGSDGGLTPRVVAYAYLTGGRRTLLKHLDDKDYDVDREIAVLRAARSELRGAADTTPGVSAA
ncbi:PH domain-containing protein [Streptomyces vinaceus]|uniref:PH domain-containing protein n=1 Tax=Streptomyces vinaceus TaxID=1960 RepID=UPI0035DBF264